MIEEAVTDAAFSAAPEQEERPRDTRWLGVRGFVTLDREASARVARALARRFQDRARWRIR